MNRTKSNVQSADDQGQEKNPTEKSIVILGDSMVKHINRWDSKVKFYVKPFSGAKTDCMIDYSKPSVQHDPVPHDPDHFILHVGASDLRLEKSLEFTAESITDLVVSLKNEKRYISISNIIVRTDNQELTKETTEVNKCLPEFCKEMNLYFIET